MTPTDTTQIESFVRNEKLALANMNAKQIRCYARNHNIIGRAKFDYFVAELHRNGISYAERLATEQNRYSNFTIPFECFYESQDDIFGGKPKLETLKAKAYKPQPQPKPERKS